MRDGQEARERSTMAVDWTDADELALLLQNTYPDVNPQSLRFSDLKDMLAGLPGSEGADGGLHEALLEAIQTAWQEEFDADRA
jgi:FeS assembly protein IscX